MTQSGLHILVQQNLRLFSLAQIAQGGEWQFTLAHDRPGAMLIWLTRGQGVCLLGGERQGVGAFNALFVPTRSLFSLEMGRNALGQVLLLPTETALPLPQIPLHLRIRDGAAQVELTAILDALGREFQNTRPMQETALEAHAGLVTVWLHRQLKENQELPAHLPDASLKLCRRFCDQLTGEKIGSGNMADMADMLQVSPTHLTRVCRARMGKTAATLINERSLHAARQLLAATKLPAQNIAQHLGFASPAYFSRFIQQHTGQPPSALRKRDIRTLIA